MVGLEPRKPGNEPHPSSDSWLKIDPGPREHRARESSPFSQPCILVTFGDIEVEEIAVEDCLDQASNDGDEVKEALEVVAPDPVEEIECTVDTQCKQVVAGDGLRLTRLAHHEQLWQDGH